MIIAMRVILIYVLAKSHNFFTFAATAVASDAQKHFSLIAKHHFSAFKLIQMCLF